jgi:hypothetical protein
MLVLDVSIAGGVGQNYLRAQIEIWDHLLQQLFAFLREELPKIAGTNGANPAAMSGSGPTNSNASTTVQ